VKGLQLNETLINVIIAGTDSGMSMAKPKAVGASKVLRSNHEISVMIGFVGTICGSISMNLSQSSALFIAGKLLGEEKTELDHYVLDGVSEVVNIIAGKMKAILSKGEYQIEKISVPSVVVGSNYYVNHYRGMTTLTVDFEFPGFEVLPLEHDLFSISLSMMRV